MAIYFSDWGYLFLIKIISKFDSGGMGWDSKLDEKHPILKVIVLPPLYKWRLKNLSYWKIINTPSSLHNVFNLAYIFTRYVAEYFNDWG